MDRRASPCPGRLAPAAVVCGAVFLALTLPSVPTGPVIGTGQDEWYNMVRGLQALYEHLNPSYFIHPALYYELLAGLYGLDRVALGITGSIGGGLAFLDYVLAHESQLLDLARYASVGCGALAVLGAVWLGQLLSGPVGGLLAGLIIASLPLLRTMATCIRVDALALAAWIAAAALIVRRYQAPSRTSLWLAAVGIGIAAAANYPGALLLLLLVWLEWARNGHTRSPARALACAYAGALALGVFIALNPYVLIDLPQFVRWFSFQVNVALATHPHAPEPSPLHYIDLLRDQGLPVAIACLAGVAAIGRPRQASGALAAFALLYLVACSAMRSQYDRFALPAIALLCIAGASWVGAQVAGRVSHRATWGCVTAAALLIVGSAAARSFRNPPSTAAPDPDYRADMFRWIVEYVPRTATLVFESDTLPLLQTAYDPVDPSGPFQASLREAFARVHPDLPNKIVKAQFIAAIYNYDPQLLDDGRVFFLASSQNREYIAANRAVLAGPAAFYDALDARAAVVHQTGGVHEQLLLYAIGAAMKTRPDSRPGAGAPPDSHP